MASYDPTATRLQLFANGYFPTPNLDKRCMLKGWASPEYVASLDEAAIKAWATERRNFKATGLLVRDGLMPIDIDVSDAVVTDIVLDALYEIMPGLEDAPWRTGKPPKLMILARWQRSTAYPDPFVRIASDKFIDEAGQSHQVEIFGGALTRSGHTSKQIGAFGPHSYEEDEAGNIIKPWTVKHEYDYGIIGDQPSPLNVPLAELPAMTQEQGWALLKRFEEIATGCGWRRRVVAPAAVGQFVYDITETSRFNVQNGPDGLTYDELCSYDLPCRVDGSFIDGSTKRRDKCLVDWCVAKDVVGVWDTEGGVWHLHERDKPAGSNEELAERLRALPGQATTPASSGRRPPLPRASARLEVKAEWLLKTQAYSALDFTVVDLFEPSDRCQTAPKAFQMLYRPWRDVGPYGPEGGKVTLTATGAWEVSTDRIDVTGVRMRPDMAFPLFEEAGARYKNTYLRPLHQAGGDLKPFLAFLDRFLPDRREREWLLDWMAHKARRPEIPGTAVVYVADDVEDPDNGKFGTGRGMMFRVATKLFGVNYTRAQSFGIVSGTSSQGTYNDWIQGSVLVMVDEAKTASPTAHRRGERNSIYEVLKDTVDPAPKRIRVNPKGRQAYDSVSFCSFWIATNHRNAMAIPKDDRRFTVLRNGRPMAQEERTAMEAWLSDNASIGALAAFLEVRDLAGFDMFMPLITTGKADMAELALSDVDELMEDLRADKARGLVFTKVQMETTIDGLLNRSSNHWRGEFASAWPAYCTAVKTPEGSWRRIRSRGTQVKLYCFRENLKKARDMPTAALMREAGKWGCETEIPGLSDALGLTKKDE